MLEAILSGSPLPGHSRSLGLPDLPLVLSQPAVVLSSQNLGGPIRVEGVRKPIYIVSEEAIQERAQREGDLLYLRFQPPQSVLGGVLLTLEIRIAQRERGLPVLGMSGVQVTFRQSGERWQAAEDTAAFAA
jgi:hypothetical protein